MSFVSLIFGLFLGSQFSAATEVTVREALISVQFLPRGESGENGRPLPPPAPQDGNGGYDPVGDPRPHNGGGGGDPMAPCTASNPYCMEDIPKKFQRMSNREEDCDWAKYDSLLSHSAHEVCQSLFKLAIEPACMDEIEASCLRLEKR